MITVTCFGGGAVVATAATGWVDGAAAGTGVASVSAAIRPKSAVALRPEATIRLVAAGCARGPRFAEP
ncbi:MAG: hypothetical protein ACXV8R_09480 [Acidimicrobiia bacterium]